MGSFLDELLRGPDDVSSFFTLWEMLASLGLSFFLCLAVGYVYRATHKGVSYSQSFTVTTVLVGMIVSVIMLIIGSNIARAFTLVGALSIIRFRNAVKQTRDVGFIFLTMSVGMACGTRFYKEAALFTGVMCAAVWLMHSLDLFARPVRHQLLRVQLPEGADPDAVLGAVLREHLESSALLSMETARQGLFLELVYSVVLRPGASSTALIQRLREVNGNAKVSLTRGEGVDL